jgi:Nucleotidyl transferase AbiEii toxin, Type IV TA system
VDDEDDDRSSRAPEPADVVRICRALNDSGARYLLIGGFAVIAHGAGRFTKDIDLLVDDAPENVARVKRALSILEDNAAAEVADDASSVTRSCVWRTRSSWTSWVGRAG